MSDHCPKTTPHPDVLLHAALHEVLARHADVNLVVFDEQGCLSALHGATFAGEYSKRFVMGHSIDQVYADMPEHGALYWEALRCGTRSQSRYAESKVWFKMHIMPLFDAQERIVGVVGVGEDITATVAEEMEEENSPPTPFGQQLGHLMDNSQDGIFMVDREFAIQRVNPAMERYNTDERILGMRCYERFFGEETPCVFCPVKECFRTSQPTHSSCFHSRLQRHFSLQAVPLFDPETGELIGAFEICRDITDLHEFEQTVRGQERGMLMLEAIPLCCCLFNKNLRMIECNREALKFFQCTSSEEACEQFPRMFPPQQPDGRSSILTVTEDMYRAFRERRASAEWTFDLAGGVAVPAHVDLVPIEHEGEELLAVYARDLRAEKAMRAKAEEAQERIRATFEAAPFGCTMSDRNFQGIECNDAILRMHGLKDKQHYIERFLTLSPPTQPCGGSSPEMALAQLNKAFDEGYAQFEWMHLTADGDPLPVEITMIRVVVNGKPLAAGYVRDLRELKRTQAALDRERAELLLAKEAAESASRTKSTFLANMSHEIRTPMNAILGLAYLAMQAGLPDETHESFRRIHSAATGLLNIINDILDFSKIEARKLELEAAPFSLMRELRDLQEIIRVRAQEKNIDLTCFVSQEVASIDYLVGDAGRLRQVLVNLLGNAIKFTESGGVIFEVEVEPQSETQAELEIGGKIAPQLSPPLTAEVLAAIASGRARAITLRFTVLDTGIGIAREALQTLFEPFSQADGSITRRFGGTGLGLAISHQLVDAMGGELHAASSYGQGSEFTVLLPFALINESAVPFSIRDARAAAPRLPSNRECLRGRRILVVEDNEINQIVTVSLLEQVGIVASCAETGQEALDMLEEQIFDLVLMDIQMPGMDGLEATRRLRARSVRRPEFATLPVVAMTAHAMSEDHAKSLEAGMNDHLTKPIEPDKLYETLCRWLEHFDFEMP